MFDDLPGAGALLNLDDDALAPEASRAAYRVLKNSGYAPAEVEALRDLREVEQAWAREHGDAERSVLIGKLNVLLARRHRAQTKPGHRQRLLSQSRGEAGAAPARITY